MGQKSFGKIREGEQRRKPWRRGVDPAHIELERSVLLSGRYINQRDVQESRKVAVVGPNVVQDLFQGRPHRQFVRINAVLFRVVGTFEDPGSRWENRVAYIPFSTAQQLYRTEGWVDQILYSTGDMATEATVAQSGRMLSWLKDVKAVHPEDSRGVRVDNNNEEYACTRPFWWDSPVHLGIGLMTLVAGAVAWRTFLAIGVKERTKEIGVRKALGATNGSIVGLVVMESTVLMLVSGSPWGWMLAVGMLSLVAPMADHEYFQNPQVDHRIALFAFGGVGPCWVGEWPRTRARWPSDPLKPCVTNEVVGARSMD